MKSFDECVASPGTGGERERLRMPTRWEYRSARNTEALKKPKAFTDLRLPSSRDAPPGNPTKTILIKNGKLAKVVRRIDWSAKGRHENDFFSFAKQNLNNSVKKTWEENHETCRGAKNSHFPPKRQRPGRWKIPTRSILAGVAMTKVEESLSRSAQSA